MKKFIPNMPDALWRVLLVFVVFISAVLLVRSAIPPALKDTNLHKQMTIERETARPLRHAGSNACADCHTEYAVKKNGNHKNLSCETCHGPAKEHSENPSEVKPVLPRLREFCAVCHVYNPSKPTGFPQINPAVHNPLKSCISCHNPHDPKPPHIPQECTACHAEIARMKAVSAHIQLECTTCHVVPQAHKLTPQVVQATIPTDRNFCGKCHGKDSKIKDTPKVDFTTHGEKYLCWQCHYPHMPEVE